MTNMLFGKMLQRLEALEKQVNNIMNQETQERIKLKEDIENLIAAVKQKSSYISKGMYIYL